MLKNHPACFSVDVGVFDEINLYLAQAKALATIASGINLETFHFSTLHDFNSVQLDLLHQLETLMLKFVMR